MRTVFILAACVAALILPACASLGQRYVEPTPPQTVVLTGASLGFGILEIDGRCLVRTQLRDGSVFEGRFATELCRTATSIDTVMRAQAEAAQKAAAKAAEAKK